MDEEPQFLTIGIGAEARSIAYRSSPPNMPDSASLFWLSGFMSDMGSTKATALVEFTQARGLGYTRFDYSGHGRSGGKFTDGTIGRWLEEAETIFTRATTGDQILVGSSMGEYIALLVVRALLEKRSGVADRIKGVVLIAPAWDMTEELMWKRFPQSTRDEIEVKGFYLRPSAYDAPYIITRNLIEDGRNHLLAGAQFHAGRPVVILQGAQDPDVPISHARALAGLLQGDIKLIEIPDGEHRLSRPQDLAALYAAIDALV